MHLYQNQITDHFGYWPSFCDGQIVSFSKNEDSIAMEIDYIDSDKSIGALVKLEFLNVSEVSLSEYMSGSVIDSLRVLSGKHHWIEIESCYGVAGSFKCLKIRATLVTR
jgi:hypothetical protein